MRLTSLAFGFWPCQRFPQMAFYVERDDDIALVRVLHGSRDTPASFQDLPSAEI